MIEVKGVTRKSVKMGGRLVPAQVIQCNYCDAELNVIHRKGRSGCLPPEALRAKAKRSGWEWSGSGKHACRDCLSKFKAISAKKVSKDDLAAIKPEEAETVMATAILSAAKDKLAQTEPSRKECKICHQVKPLEQFSLSSANKTDGRHSYCKPCDRERVKVRDDERRAKKRETEALQQVSPTMTRIEQLKELVPNLGEVFGLVSEGREMPEAKLREMSREDRRKVWRAIDENYDDVNQHYIGAVTDNTIAHDLSVPRAWVTTIRETDFGPAGSNEEMADVAKSLSALSKSLDETMELALNVAAKAESLTKEAASLRKRVEEIERSVGPRRVS